MGYASDMILTVYNADYPWTDSLNKNNVQLIRDVMSQPFLIHLPFKQLFVERSILYFHIP